MPRTSEKLDLVFVDSSNYDPSNPYTPLPVLLAGAIKGDGDSIKDKLCDIYIPGFYCADLPDWNKVNEAMLEFGITYLDKDNDEEQNGSFARDFRVRDASRPGGYLHFLVFKDVRLGQRTTLSIELNEIDKKYDISAIMGILDDTDIVDGLSLGGAIPYVRLGSKIYNGIADLVLKDDLIWKETAIDLRRDHDGSPGGPAALKDGTYCLVATTDTKGNVLRNWRPDYSDVLYLGNVLYRKVDDRLVALQTNYLFFSLQFYTPDETRAPARTPSIHGLLRADILSRSD